MDATPVTLGQEFSGYASLIDERTKDIENSLNNVRKLAIGGTAVGTGINAPDNFGKDVSHELEQSLGTPFQEIENHFTRQGSREEIVQLSGALKSLAVSLFKIANDIRWMGSGPVSGLGELKIPALQPGSSIMPGKVNPVIPEMMMQVSAQVIGNDTAITFSAANGNFELNTMLPIMAHNILESISILTSGAEAFTEKLIIGLEANTEKLDENIQKNSILVTALVPKLGYDVSAEIAKEAIATNSTIKKVLLDRNLLSEQEIDELLDIEKLI
jgi:fumarate hydratase class II